MSVTGALFRIYRPIAIPFAGLVVLAELIIVGLVSSTKDMGFSMWLTLAGSAAKYWLLVVGIMLVVMQLRQFVVNGVTRHEFLAGAGVFGLILAVGFALAVVLGHGLESVVLEALGKRAAGYPSAAPGALVREFGHILPETLAYLVSGAMIAAGFYRWRAWLGLVVMVGGAIPAAIADGLLGVDEFGGMGDRVPYAAALVLSVVATAAVAVAFHRAISDVAIKRTGTAG